LLAYGYDAITFAFVPAGQLDLARERAVLHQLHVDRVEHRLALIVSNTRDAPPFANEKPAVPGPSDDALYDAAAKPEAAHARGVGDGDGDGDGDDAGLALGAGEAAGVVGCASANAGTAHSAPAAVKAAMKSRKRPPNLRKHGWRKEKNRTEHALRTASIGD